MQDSTLILGDPVFLERLVKKTTQSLPERPRSSVFSKLPSLSVTGDADEASMGKSVQGFSYNKFLL